MLAIKSRAKFEQVASKIRSFREQIASICTYDSEPHCISKRREMNIYEMNQY